jgi:type II secretory pathway pseudopilin PulG
MALGVQRHPETISAVPARRVRRAFTRAFTMIDVLVTMAVIAVLMSILMPTLSSVRETARQVVCRSNVRQMGMGLTQFAEGHADRLPHSVFTEGTGTNYKPWDTMTLRIAPGSGWDGLGFLYSDEFTPAPLVFYCPSHKGENPYIAFEDAWGSDQGLIVGNFQYRGRAPAAGLPLSDANRTDRLSAMASNVTLIADGFRAQTDFNHEMGAATFGANLFRADSSVGWFTDRPGSAIAQIPKDTTSTPASGDYDQVWQELDHR